MSLEGAERVAKIRAKACCVAAWGVAIYAVAFAAMMLMEIVSMLL